VSDKGYLQDFFQVYASEQTKANVLSYAEVEYKYPITYVPCMASLHTYLIIIYASSM